MHDEIGPARTAEPRIGVMGGTFDPIHHGHLVAASEVADQFGLDEVVFVPTGQPWQKSERESPAEDRYLMTVIATASNPQFSVSRVDIDRSGPTYTVDTLADLHKALPTRSCSSSPAPMRWPSPLVARGRTGLPRAHFIRVTRPGYELGDDHLPEGAVTLIEEFRRWPFRRPTAVVGWRRAGRSGISSPTVWCSTSPSDTCTGGGPPPRPPRSRIRRACTVRRAVELRRSGRRDERHDSSQVSCHSPCVLPIMTPCEVAVGKPSGASCRIGARRGSVTRRLATGG